MKCQRICYSPYACKGWGYCRQRNIDAGGMQNVTPAMQQEWRRADASPAERARGEA